MSAMRLSLRHMIVSRFFSRFVPVTFSSRWLDYITNNAQRVVDRMKTSPEDCDLLLVGGGSIIAPTSLRGVGNIMLVSLWIVELLLFSFKSLLDCPNSMK